VINRDASSEVLDVVVPTARTLGIAAGSKIGQEDFTGGKQSDAHKDGLSCPLHQFYPRLLSSLVVGCPEGPQLSSDNICRPRVRVVYVFVEGCRGTLNSQINEPKVVIGEITIVVIQPVIGEQIRCGVEGLNCGVARDPTSEMPILDI